MLCPSGAFNSSTIIVMITAITPSLNASSLPVPIPWPLRKLQHPLECGAPAPLLRLNPLQPNRVYVALVPFTATTAAPPSQRSLALERSPEKLAAPRETHTPPGPHRNTYSRQPPRTI